MTQQAASLALTDLSVTTLSTVSVKRSVYIAFQLGTQVHSTGVSETGRFNEPINFVNTPLKDDGQMLITVCIHDPAKAPEVVGQTVVSVKQLLSSTGVQTYCLYNFQGTNTGSILLKAVRSSSAASASPPPTTAGASATAGTASGPAPTTQAPKKASFMDQARGGLSDTLGSLHRGLEDAKTKLNVGQGPYRQAQQPSTSGAPYPGASPAAAGAAPTAPSTPAPGPGQHYTTQELSGSMLFHTKSLLADLASYTQYGLERARTAVGPKPNAQNTKPTGRP